MINILKNLFAIIWGLILIISSPTVFAQESESNTIRDATYFNYIIKFFEFHVGYIKITNIIQIQNPDAFCPLLSSSDLYSANDLFDIKISNNITDCLTSIEKDNWRGATYECMRFFGSLHNSNGEIIKPTQYIITYKTARLPHLHNTKPISKNEIVNMTEVYDLLEHTKKLFIVMALPVQGEYKGDGAFKPDKILKMKDWVLLIYDLSLITTKVSIRPSFIIYEDSPELDIYTAMELATNIKGDKIDMISYKRGK